MKTRIQKWGNSLAIRIPKAFAIEVNLENHSEVDISLQDGALVIEPTSGEVDFDSLLNKVNKKNRHGLIEFGPPVGREKW